MIFSLRTSWAQFSSPWCWPYDLTVKIIWQLFWPPAICTCICQVTTLQLSATSLFMQYQDQATKKPGNMVRFALILFVCHLQNCSFLSYTWTLAKEETDDPCVYYCSLLNFPNILEAKDCIQFIKTQSFPELHTNYSYPTNIVSWIVIYWFYWQITNIFFMITSVILIRDILKGVHSLY